MYSRPKTTSLVSRVVFLPDATKKEEGDFEDQLGKEFHKSSVFAKCPDFVL